MAPAISSVVYNHGTGELKISGSYFVKEVTAGNDIDATKFEIRGEGGTHTLTTTGVGITDISEFTFTLNGVDKVVVNGLLNEVGTQADDGTIVYNFEALDIWMPGTDTDTDIASASNAISVSNYQKPVIVSATYDASTGLFTVTGNYFARLGGGATNDVDISMIEITGEGGATYDITSVTNVDITDETTFSFAVAGDDKLYVDGLLNKNLGQADDGSTNYNMKVNDDWMVASATSVDIMDSSATIAVTGYVLPTYTSAAFDYNSGAFIVTGANFAKMDGATNDVDASRFTIVGEGGVSYQLTTTPDVDITNAVSFTLTLSVVDHLHVRGLWNKNGNTADSGATFNFQAADGWTLFGPGNENMATSSSTVGVSNWVQPSISASTVAYDYQTGEITFSGTYFASQIGANNDLVANSFTAVGEGTGTYTLASSSNVDITSLTTAAFTVSDDDRLALNALWNKNGGTADDTSSPLQLNVADDWMAAAAGK